MEWVEARLVEVRYKSGKIEVKRFVYNKNLKGEENYKLIEYLKRLAQTEGCTFTVGWSVMEVEHGNIN